MLHDLAPWMTLRALQEHNGKRGHVSGFDAQRSRYEVRLEDEPQDPCASRKFDPTVQREGVAAKWIHVDPVGNTPNVSRWLIHVYFMSHVSGTI